MKKVAILAIFLALCVGACEKRGDKSEPDKEVPISAWYSLQMGQAMWIGDSSYIRRVPGGWMYHYGVYSYGKALAFIPFSKEEF